MTLRALAPSLAVALALSIVCAATAHAQAPGEPPAAAETAEAAASDPPAPARSSAPVRWRLSIEAPDDVRAVLAQYLDIARVERSPDMSRVSRFELRRLVSATPAQARALLETQGYFLADVNARLDEAGGENALLTAVVQVTPGTRTQVQSARIEFEGPLAVADEQKDDTARTLTRRLRDGWQLPPGKPFTQGDWSAAKNTMLATLRAEGYPAATISGSTAQVEAVDARARLFVYVDSGPMYRFGAIQYEGLANVRENDMAYLLPFAEGERYREQLLLDFQDRLVKTGLFETVSVSADTDVESGNTALPVRVRVREQFKQQVTAGIGFTDASGPRVTLEHVHQRLFGFAWQAKTEIRLGRDARSVQVDLTSHPKPGLYRNLLSGAAERSTNAGLVINSQRARIGRTQDTERIERLYYLEYQRATSRPEDGSSALDEASSLTANYQWVWRRLDHPVLPTKGLISSLEIGGGYSFATTRASGPFTRGKARVTAYWPFGTTLYTQLRAEIGEVFANTDIGVPFTLLFRTGGDDSVRGYAYQSLGPVSDGRAVGGRVLGTASIEVARPFSAKQPAWWGAVFVDAGDAAVTWTDFAPAVGAGFGVRWRSPVGPLRIDLAYGDALRKWRLHFSVGIVF
jgi:translocation and assembly module TamA